MKVSVKWLQTFFSAEGGSASGGRASLPDAQALADALTFHAFEIESTIESTAQIGHAVSNFVLDVKVTPNRGHDCLSHRGIAKEISAILNIPMKNDPLALRFNLNSTLRFNLNVSIENPRLCSRYIAGYIRGVKVGPSPDWLRESLESIGQKSINNIVDAANYIMFNIGQPLHAFDAEKLVSKDEQYSIIIRNARKPSFAKASAGEGEKMVSLDGKEYALTDSMLVIADGERVLGVAGVKGGKAAEVNEATTDIIIESANFDGASVRKTAQALKLRTDASQRFEQSLSPELAAYGMRAVADMIVQLAGGELVGFVDEYPVPQEKKELSISLQKINSVLGTNFTQSQVEDVFNRLGLPHTCDEASPHRIFKVEVPFERLDLEIPEDITEEIARIEGYDKIPVADLPSLKDAPDINENFYQTEKIREELMQKGYSEVYTSIFAEKGERVVANKVDGVRPYLRSNLSEGLAEALQKNVRNKDLLGLKEVKLFEIGTVWKGGKESTVVGMAIETKQGGKITEAALNPIKSDHYDDFPIPDDVRYRPFSKFPFIVRDIALWTAAGTKPEEILELIRKESGSLLVRSELFDTFSAKGGSASGGENRPRISYAFRLVLQSFEKTLTDEEANAVMENVYKEVKKRGWEPR
ncbi:MAG: phenylalanine--tRNA ligase subunit beta [bacterium]|nr:phenylalanine--tRNA ligase subunit beta [bacterium]